MTLKISELWSAFEHLVRITQDIVPVKGNSRIDLYNAATLNEIGFCIVTGIRTNLLYDHVLHQSECRQEMYGSFLPYLAKNAKGGTRTAVGQVYGLIKTRQPLREKHILGLAYRIRNSCAFQGISAALGSRNSAFKQAHYLVIFDILALYSLTLSD